MINFQLRAFLDLNNFCNKHKNRQTNLLKTTVHKFYPLWSVSHSSLATFGHMLTFIRYIEVIYFTYALLDCVRDNEDFAKSRFVISRFWSIHFILILARLKKIVRYTEDFIR